MGNSVKKRGGCQDKGEDENTNNDEIKRNIIYMNILREGGKGNAKVGMSQ